MADIPGDPPMAQTVATTTRLTDAQLATYPRSEEPHTGPRDFLRAGERLGVGGSVVSPDGRWKYEVSEDGSWVQCDMKPAAPNIYGDFWKTKTSAGSEAELVMQDDGNLVLLADGYIPKWSTESHGKGDSTSVLRVGNFGNAYITSKEEVIWRTQVNCTLRCAHWLKVGEVLSKGMSIVSPNRRHRMTLSYWGRFSLWNDGKEVWKVRSDRIHSVVVRENDEVVVIAGFDEVVWHSFTQNEKPFGNAALGVRDDGSAVIKVNNRYVWSTTPSLIMPSSVPLVRHTSRVSHSVRSILTVRS